MGHAATTKKKIFDDRYEILSIVGRGAHSVVYHAKYINTPHNEVALKVLVNKAGDSSATDQLRREALAMVASRHKYTIRLDDFHSVGQVSYLAMEYAPHGDLRKYINSQSGKLPIIQIERFFLQIAESLAFMHKAGILHRDIKPDNILVVNDRQARLADFGVAVLPGEVSSIEELQKGVGTMDYMAPEILEGIECTKRSDVYLLGITFYEILTGLQPFANIPLIEVISKRRTENITAPRLLREEAPQYLEDVIMRAIDFDPAKRYESAVHLFEALTSRQAKHITAKSSVNTILSPLSNNKPTSILSEQVAIQDKSDLDAQSELTEINPSEDTTTKKKKRRRPRRRNRKKSVATSLTPTKVNEDDLSYLLDDDDDYDFDKELENLARELEEGEKSITASKTSIQPESTNITKSSDLEQTKTNDLTASATNIETTKSKSVETMFGSEEDSMSGKNKTNKTSREHTASKSNDKKIKPGYSIEDFQKSATSGYQDLYKATDKQKSKSFLSLIIFIVLLVWVADFSLKYFTNRGIADIALEITGLKESAEIFPEVKTDQLEFPNLSAVYLPSKASKAAFLKADS
jgi:serine/threonine protein kinase